MLILTTLLSYSKLTNGFSISCKLSYSISYSTFFFRSCSKMEACCEAPPTDAFRSYSAKTSCLLSFLTKLSFCKACYMISYFCVLKHDS